MSPTKDEYGEIRNYVLGIPVTLPWMRHLGANAVSAWLSAWLASWIQIVEGAVGVCSLGFFSPDWHVSFLLRRLNCWCRAAEDDDGEDEKWPTGVELNPKDWEEGEPLEDLRERPIEAPVD